MIFVKNLIQGKVKTRLACSLGQEVALTAYCALLVHTREVAAETDADKAVFYSDFIEEGDAWSRSGCMQMRQQGSDLGERMQAAFRYAFEKKYQRAVLIGSDCPEITPVILQDAFALLDNHDIVLGPATDGGYYLLGMRALRPELFADIPWSTPKVLETTISRICGAGLSLKLLPMLSDVDDAKDYEAFKHFFRQYESVFQTKHY